MTDELRLVAINGMLGYGYELTSLENGIAAEPHLLGVDAGSTDAGPFYLGHGRSLTSARQVERDLDGALRAVKKAGVPLVIGSAGFGGSSVHVDFCLERLAQVAGRMSETFRCAVIRSDLNREMVKRAIIEQKVRPLGGAPEIGPDDIDDLTQLVGQIDTEAIAVALAEAEVEIVVAGRACDTAVYATLPIMKGFDPGLALHMAKIMECGAQCAIPLAPNDCLLGIMRRDSFLIRTLNPNRTVTPESVAAHSLYEQPDPYELHEPEGTVDMIDTLFEQIDDRTVKVSGSCLRPKPGPKTIKMEGAKLAGYRAVTIAGVHDSGVIENLDAIFATAKEMAVANLSSDMDPGVLTADMRVYGRDAVLGHLEPRASVAPREVGVLLEVIGPTQEAASAFLALLRSSMLHCPFEGRKTTAGNLAFPFSPSDLEGGPVYEFSVYHLLETEDHGSLFAPEFITIGG